ncbi:MAG: hypothetical protein ACRDPE_11400 [Solirubrobacterales bacterium]
MIWATLVPLAAGLVAQESEAAKRTAINRAYYGVFNEARRRLEAHGIRIDDHRAHGQVWLTFRDADGADSEADVKWQQVGVLGRALQTLRNQADYVDDVPWLDREAINAVGIAQRILPLLDELEFS